MPIPPRAVVRLTLLGAVASLLVAIAGVIALRERARAVDVVAAVGGGVGALASLAAWRRQRRRLLHPPAAPARAR